MTGFIRANGWPMLTAAMVLFIAIGQFQERQVGAEAQTQDQRARIERLEELAAQERARLDGVYLRRDVGDALLQTIANTLDALDKRLARIEGRLP